jgi:hypothetical protein
MIWNQSRNFVSIALLSVFFLLVNTTNALSQTELVVEGNVLGYELNTVKITGMDGYFPEYPVLARITKILKGEEKSQYIIVLPKFLDKEYAEKNFGLDKTTTFRLERRINYVKKVKHLLHSGFSIENGKLVKTAQTFTFVPGVDKQSLPLEKKIPCYV